MGVFLLILFIQVTFASVTVLPCRNKEDCLEGYTCVDSICQKCLKCNMLFRKGNSCVADFNECGDCLEGFEEILVTPFSAVIKPCKPIKKKIKLKECIDNNGCPPNNYCNEETCVKCFDCGLLSRVAPVGKCAKGLNDCGSCLHGFHAVAVTTDTNTKACERNASVSQETHNSQKFSQTEFLPICLGIIGYFIIECIIMMICYRDQLVNDSSSQNICSVMNHPSAPPMYEFDSSKIVTGNTGIDVPLIHYETDKKQKAKVFKLPDASYYREGEETTNNESGGDQISENNENILSGSFDANRSEPEEGSCSGEILTQGFDGLPVNDSTIDSFPQPHENLTENNDFTLMNSVAVDVVDAVQADEDLVNDAPATAHLIPTIEKGEL